MRPCSQPHRAAVVVRLYRGRRAALCGRAGNFAALLLATPRGGSGALLPTEEGGTLRPCFQPRRAAVMVRFCRGRREEHCGLASSLSAGRWWCVSTEEGVGNFAALLPATPRGGNGAYLPREEWETLRPCFQPRRGAVVVCVYRGRREEHCGFQPRRTAVVVWCVRTEGGGGNFAALLPVTPRGGNGAVLARKEGGTLRPCLQPRRGAVVVRVYRGRSGELCGLASGHAARR